MKAENIPTFENRFTPISVKMTIESKKEYDSIMSLDSRVTTLEISKVLKIDTVRAETLVHLVRSVAAALRGEEWS